MKRQLAQWLLEGCDDEYSEIQHITVKQDGTNFPGSVKRLILLHRN